jgi:glycosyltransferase involved in cell wall biosynthesis
LTSFHEGSPNVIKEAMACNCPIVSTDVGDVKDVIGNTEGCYITTFDLQDVIRKIKMALDFGKRTKGRERIMQAGLDSKTIANRIIDVYHQVLKS